MNVTLSVDFLIRMRKLRAYLKENPGAHAKTHPHLPAFNLDSLAAAEVAALVGFAEAHDIPFDAITY